MTSGQIHHTLTNPIYIGKIRHKDKIHDGLHEAIISSDLWQRVQDRLIANSGKPRRRGIGLSASSGLSGKVGKQHNQGALLKGLLYDA